MSDIQPAPAPPARALSPPRGAAFFGSTTSPSEDKPTSPPTSRSPSRSRSPATGIFQSITRSLSRSVSRSRTSPPASSSAGAGATHDERQPRGMAGFGGSSREPSQSRGRAGAVQAESGGRVSSLSRTRAALERVAEFVTPPSVAVSTAPAGSDAHGHVEKGKGVAGGANGIEEEGARGRAGKENLESGVKGRGESRSRSVGRQILAGLSHDRSA
ncbi:hypothetical protein JCM6882_009467 [Rhodosporidiobolus microsporus]